MGGGSSKTTDSTTNTTQDDLLNSLITKIQSQQQTQQQQTAGQSVGTQAQTGQTTQTQGLATGQQPNVDLLMAGARDAFAQGGTDPMQEIARQQAASYAGGVGQTLVNNAQTGASHFLDINNLFDTNSIPGFAASKQGVVDTVNKNLMEKLLPSIRSGSIMNNTLGGTAQDVSQGQVVQGVSDDLGRTLAGMDMNAYSQNLGQYQNAQNQAGQTYGLGLLPSQTLENLGAQNTADDRANLAALQQFTGQAGQYGGTNTSATTGQATTSEATRQSVDTQINDILQSLGLSTSEGHSEGTSKTHTVEKNESQVGFMQILGTVIALAAAIPSGGASLAAIPAMQAMGGAID